MFKTPDDKVAAPVPVTVKLVTGASAEFIVTSPVPPDGDIDILSPAVIFVTPPDVPLAANIILPCASTVKFVLV